jgi:hypothetical protein
MEEWNKMVRLLKDDSVEPNKTGQLCERVYQDVHRMRVKDKGKFKQRMGSDFDMWALELQEQFPRHLIIEILNNDEFWKLTLKVTRGW